MIRATTTSNSPNLVKLRRTDAASFALEFTLISLHGFVSENRRACCGLAHATLRSVGPISRRSCLSPFAVLRNLFGNITVLFEPLFNRLFRSIGDITCASVLNLLNDWAGGLYLFAGPRNHSDQETCHDHVPEFHKLLHGASIFSGRSPYAACQILAGQRPRPPVPSGSAPPDRLVYSVSP